MNHEYLIRQAFAGDAVVLGKIIGQAFAQDPVSVWAIGSEAMILRTYSTLTASIYLPRGQCDIMGDLAGALWMDSTGNKNLSLYNTLVLGVHYLTHGHPKHTWRTLLLDEALKKRRPKVPHMHLFAVGVLPKARRQGMGQKIIQNMLDRCDATKTPVFLENTNPANQSFYEGLGFVSAHTYSPVKGCPPVTEMWRQPGHRRSV